MGNALQLAVERLNGGQPILKPTANLWENWTVFNAAAIYLAPGTFDGLVPQLLPGRACGDPALRDGIVVVHYRASPKDWIGFPPSLIGLAIFTPRLELLYRHPEPVVRTGLDPRGYDFTSVEDPRVTRIGDVFYMLYCGYTVFQDGSGRMEPCYARSTDLLHWEKLGPFHGEVVQPNKDHVLFPEMIEGYYFMLHRPCLPRQSDFAMQLAMSDHPGGWWKNLGVLFAADQLPQYQDCWNGAGTVPIPLGNKRFLHIYHTGLRFPNQDRVYAIDACIFDFNQFDPRNPASVVTQRLEHLLLPETAFETNAPDDTEHKLDCLFPCGSYVFGDDLTIVYGGANAYVLGCRVNLSDLLQELEQRD